MHSQGLGALFSIGGGGGIDVRGVVGVAIVILVGVVGGNVRIVATPFQ